MPVPTRSQVIGTKKGNRPIRMLVAKVVNQQNITIFFFRRNCRVYSILIDLHWYSTSSINAAGGDPL